ncbi:penicillin-binding transpeptidase domain-containing protein, partial [Phyllobacterium sp.]|nr:penicillin-binding protein [Phyllobacterium sp.]
LPSHTLVVRTTLDTGIQKAAEESAEYHLRQFGKEYHVTQAAIVVLETNGAVRAIVGGRDYGESQFNRATAALRQAGSSFKPYVYAAAMEKGMTPKTMISGGAVSWGNWSPQNYSRQYLGQIDLTTALVKSINTVPVRLAKDYLTTAPIVALAKAMGVESVISSHKTMVLGTSGMTVMDQATGYNTFATGGLAGVRHAFTQVSDQNGKLLWDWKTDGNKPHRALTEKAAFNMNIMLSQVPEWGTGRRAALPMTRVAGKTGTTQSYRDAWFVGFTGNYTAAVWFGNDNFTPTKELTGGILPAMTWQRFMNYAHQNIDLKPIPGIDPAMPKQDKVAAAKPATADEEALKAAERPRVLSNATVTSLREIGQALKEAPALKLPDVPTKISAR